MWKVQLFKLNYDKQESQAVKDVVDSGWITMGEKTKEFESNFASYLGGGVEAVAVSNGTAALHMALLALDVGVGDEVIVASLTFVADINVVKLVGATPILADCTSYEDWNISPADIESKITKKTKAVIVVHYAGYSCDMDAISNICKKYKIALIEDASHAPGAKYNGKYIGSIGDIGCFSFFTNKNLSVGEGGMVVAKDPKIVQSLRYFRSHGMTALTLDRHKGRAVTYDVEQPGLNYRIDEMRSALGVIQLSKLEKANKQRELLVKEYVRQLKDVNKINLPFLFQLENDKYLPSYHILPILLDVGIDRLSVIASLKDDGIQSSIHYPSFQEFTAYKDANLGKTPIANDISKRELTLPLYPTMTFEEVTLVCDALKRALV
ncbi:DegT/DnrJ/EryC1/StrS family aminotransferase [Campylobacter geochelonis]|uniref:DegT/DnrJ/EryC1/StrS family aminotransferase n=1 Tax=Campylobacter geochelonis TaxID=1780362 RepID=UPI0007707C0A|nr:DegT/DnrJ/EryC1/StrS family aminotransferase [Campylobacter geochelonis]CZE49304.1 DegT/DnrJ/EryC1/StrS aminotransferase [Campylobacter geochelonis]CZE51417.1 DegT/DnrJ/EryC1/StrS aminotransferase [Campylobacter geochelonis]